MSFENVIQAGGVTQIPSAKRDTTFKSTTEKRESSTGDSTTWDCQTKTIDLITGNSEFPLFNPNASVIYPGSLLQGASLQQGTPDVIPVKRDSGCVSIDLLNGSPTAHVCIREVRKSSISQALNDIIGSNPNGILPANFVLVLKKSNPEINSLWGLV